MLKFLTGLKVLVFEDLGFLTAISMYPQIGCKQKCQWIKVKQGLKFLWCLLPYIYFWPPDRCLDNCLMNYLC